jgi:hypothetical protein
MIETLMALWNRGVSGRLMVMVVTFFCLCISISLLFVTVGSIWGPLLSHGQPGGREVRVSNPALITATAPPATATATVVGELTLPPNPCLASSTGQPGNTPRVGATRNREKSGFPSRTATSAPLRGTPQPSVTIPPGPSPTVSPTLPAVTPTVPVTPTATAQPTITPTVTTTPVNTPTVVTSPTGTSTPGATPAPTPTVPGSIPTAGITPTDTPTPVTTATVTTTAPAGSPTGGVTSKQARDGRPQGPSAPAGTNSGQTGQGNCLGDTLFTGGESALLSRLQDFLWIILVSSLLGTTLFCAQMYRLSRNPRR